MAASQRPRPRARKASADPPSAGHNNGLKAKVAKASSPLLPIPKEDSDDDDDFFTRRRALNGSKAVSAPTLTLGDGLHSEDLEVEGSTSAEDDDQDTVRSSDDDESRKRKKSRTKLPSWTKSNSLSKLDATSRLPSSSRLSVEVIGSTDSESRPLAKKVRANESDHKDDDDEYDEDMAPPPQVHKEMLERLRVVLNQHNGPSLTELIGEDEEDAILKEVQQPSDLDPDLIRMMKTDRAREARKLAKESEARRRAEIEQAEKDSRITSSVKSSQRVQQIPKMSEVIEVEDSDDESWRARQTTRVAASSSPVQMVSPPPPRRRDPEPSSHQALMNEPVQAALEETERIGVIMKGGDGGTLIALVRVKPTTQIKKLLDHYIDTHKESIPAAKRKSVKLRFDGEWLGPTSTVGEVGIEDDEQIDVIW